MEFEWDEAKRLATLEGRALDFENCRLVIAHLFWERPIPRTGEPRWLITDWLDDELVTFVFTWRNGVRRVISMRIAKPREQDGYRALYG